MNQNIHKRLDILDSLRGLAAVIVCFHHFFSMNYDYFQNISSSKVFLFLGWVSNLNHLAVLFFFVLSGFSIGLSLKSKDVLTIQETNVYFYKRFKRILPVYILSLVFTVIVGAAIPGHLSKPDYSFINLLGNLLFLQTSKTATDYWFTPYGLNGPLWSLSYEMFFYLIFPAILYFNKKVFFKIPLVLRLFGLLFLSIVCILFNKQVYIPYFAFFSFFIIWITGYIVSRSYILNKQYHSSIGVLLAVAITYLALQHLLPSDSLRGIFEGITIAGIFYTFIKIRERMSRRLFYFPERFINTLFNYTGKGSYALYAFHFPVLFLLKYFNLPFVSQIVTLILLIPISKFIEEWFIRKKLAFLQLRYLPENIKIS